jgi:glutaredoxin
MSNRNIKIYTSASCGYCGVVKDKLDEAKIKYTEVETSGGSEEWDKVVDLTGMGMVPTIVINDTSILIPARDFPNAEHLVRVLETFTPLKYPLEVKTYERLLTLNYNLGVGLQAINRKLHELENKLNEKEN